MPLIWRLVLLFGVWLPGLVPTRQPAHISAPHCDYYHDYGTV